MKKGPLSTPRWHIDEEEVQPHSFPTPNPNRGEQFNFMP